MASVTVEEYELLADPKYRSYISAVDKALKNFEYTSEWADLISALGKLNKVLINHLRYPVIPRRIVVSKRLAQCLHPALPSGVHLKALETYDIVFKCIGTNRLSQELFIYSAGLFPLLGNAAMNVRPALLNIYETHFVPLATRLRPGLSGFLTGVLSGFEEGSEYHDRTNFLLEKVCEGVHPNYFYGCLWECVVANPNVRLPAILFVIAHYNKKKSMEDQLHIVGTNVDLMVQALCAAIQDNSVLVQRSALDLLLMGFPMHNSQLIKSDMERIQTAAVYVVLRRDMSLNRRLWSWLLGTETNFACPPQLPPVNVEKARHNSQTGSESGMSNVYFDTYSKDLLVQALRTCLKDSRDSGTSSTIDVRPYRILISLFDKPEVSSAILDDVLIEVFRTLYKECKSINNELNESENNHRSTKNKISSSQKNYNELIKTANLLFGTFEPYYIWEYVGTLFSKACNTAISQHTSPSKKIVKDVGEGPPSILEMCELVEFLLEVITIETYVETQTEHLPELLRYLVNALSQHIKSMTSREMTDAVKLCAKILAKVQPPVMPVGKDETTIVNDASPTSPDVTILDQESSLDSLTSENSVPSVTNDVSVKEREEKQSILNTSEMTSRRTLIHNCVHAFQDFFVQLVTERIFGDSSLYVKAFQQLVIGTRHGDEERTRGLEKLLWTCLEDKNTEASGDGKKEVSETSTSAENVDDVVLQLDVVENVCEFVSAFSSACQMMVEFSSFPMYCSQNVGLPRTQISSSLSINTTDIPDWLRVLLVAATSVRHMEIQFTSVTTLHDLITITQSVVQETATCETSDTTSQGTVSVVIVPLLEAGHLDFINNNTYFYEVVAKQLWDKLEERSLNHHRRAADLLNQIHGLAPSEKLVEDVICRSMARGDELSQVESFRHFATLWHLLRDLPVKSDTNSKFRMYDRCLFMMLDCLQTDVGPHRTEVQSWFTHSLQRGDICRILEPILLVLLHPDTARVSVQHVNIQQPRKVRLAENIDDGSSSEAKIYAISSVEGHVFYHVSDDTRQPTPTSANNYQSRRVFALTSLASETSSEVVTANAGLSDFDLPSSHEQGVRSPILLFINPIGGLTWGDDNETSTSNSTSTAIPDLRNVRRINTSTLQTQNEIQNQTDEASFDALESPVTESPPDDVTSSIEIVETILDELLDLVCDDDDDVILEDASRFTDPDVKFNEPKNRNNNNDDNIDPNPEDVRVHPLHTHILLYCQVYDSKRVLYVLNLLRSILRTNPRVVLSTMSTSSLAGSRTPRHVLLNNLLARHRRSVFGKGFHSELPQESVTVFRSSMVLEVVISVCLYFVRGFYPNLAQMRLTDEEISGNREVQLAAVDVLTLVITELLPVVKVSGRGFASYIRDLLSRCRVQKALLHCLLSNVYAAGNKPSLEGGEIGNNGPAATFTEVIMEFNEVPRRSRGVMNGQTCDYSEAFQVCMLRLLLGLIVLEDQVSPQKGENDVGGRSDGERSRSNFIAQGSTVRYQQGISIPCQPMFLTAVLCAIKQQQARHLHRHWLTLVTSALPHLGRALSQVVIIIINQLCHNIEALADQYKSPSKNDGSLNEASSIPIDYVMTLLDGLTTLCHYCVLDSPPQVSLFQPTPWGHQQDLHGPNAGQIINNLINVFTPSVVQKDSGLSREITPPVDPLIAVRRSLLSHLPRIVSALSTMWQAVELSEKSSCQQHPCWLMGTPKAIKQKILEFLSPITHHHGTSFLASVGVVWIERRKKGPISLKRVIPAASEEQLVLVNLVSSIKVMPLDTLIQTVRHVTKQPPPSNSMAVKAVPLEVSVLQFFFSYVQTISSSALIESWSALLGLFKEGLQLPLVPPAQFLLIGVLNEFVQNAAPFEEKKDQKDLQDIAQKLIEAVSIIAGACLEQTTWLRRSLAVKPGPQLDIADSDSDVEDHAEKSSSVPPEFNENGSQHDLTTANSVGQHSVQALSILAELLAPLLDVIFMSDEKEKIIPLLNNVMYNVTPYLKNHNQHNIPSFRACSQLLANLSSYQYTRKAWKRDALDLLLDPCFFQMTESCLRFWQTTVDNLMTHDKTTFRDLMARVTVTQSASLNLFSSREQEYEQRAQLLKRLAFVIFSGEVDQYQNFMPDIQERLSESLRIPQVPSVQSQVFLCFRVLLVRMSPQHITSLWPIIITEMVQVFLQIEQELNTDSEEFSSHLRRLSTLDSSWVVSPNNGLNAHNHPAWFQLYLAACKLLDLSVTLPADRLPQFQMYRWAFVGDITNPSVNNNNEVEISSNMKNQSINSSGFMPHITRLAYLLNKKVANEDILPIRPGQPLLTMSSIKSLTQLQPFFNTLVVSLGQTQRSQANSNTSVSQPVRQSSDEALLETLTSYAFKPKGSFVHVEKTVQRDFLESLGQS